LKECIAELEAFDPQKVNKRYSEPEVKALEASIDEALAAAFGHATPTFGRYANAAKLDQGPHIMRTSGTWGSGHRVDYDVQDQADARRYLMEGKPRSIALLQSAIKALENRLKNFDFEAVVEESTD
jgi:hypothetical protein